VTGNLIAAGRTADVVDDVAASWFLGCARMRAWPAGPAGSSALHSFARSGPTKEAHRRAINRSGGLQRLTSANRPRPATLGPPPPGGPITGGLGGPIRGGIREPLEGPIRGKVRGLRNHHRAVRRVGRNCISEQHVGEGPGAWIGPRPAGNTSPCDDPLRAPAARRDGLGGGVTRLLCVVKGSWCWGSLALCLCTTKRRQLALCQAAGSFCRCGR
jgi:hypothetical protein